MSTKKMMNKKRSNNDALLCGAVVFAFILLLVIIPITKSFISANTRREQMENYDKYYTSYAVSYGDTVSDLYNVYRDQYTSIDDVYTLKSWCKEVKSINHLNDDYTITSGTMLVVPYVIAK